MNYNIIYNFYNDKTNLITKKENINSHSDLSGNYNPLSEEIDDEYRKKSCIHS